LNGAGLKTVMLTGDNRLTAEAVGRELGIDVRAELLPQDKQRIVRDMQGAGERVAKVGDGINDAPALATAYVGIAMGGGTDVALETADAAVLHGRVTDIAEMIALSKRTMANIRQNITIALGLKAVFLVTTVAGVTGLWPCHPRRHGRHRAGHRERHAAAEDAEGGGVSCKRGADEPA
jgi:Cd2+/Zn2+-exporting ATPase